MHLIPHRALVFIMELPADFALRKRRKMPNSALLERLMHEFPNTETDAWDPLEVAKTASLRYVLALRKSLHFDDKQSIVRFDYCFSQNPRVTASFALKHELNWNLQILASHCSDVENFAELEKRKRNIPRSEFIYCIYTNPNISLFDKLKYYPSDELMHCSTLDADFLALNLHLNWDWQFLHSQSFFIEYIRKYHVVFQDIYTQRLLGNPAITEEFFHLLNHECENDPYIRLVFASGNPAFPLSYLEGLPIIYKKLGENPNLTKQYIIDHIGDFIAHADQKSHVHSPYFPYILQKYGDSKYIMVFLCFANSALSRDDINDIMRKITHDLADWEIDFAHLCACLNPNMTYKWAKSYLENPNLKSRMALSQNTFNPRQIA